MKENLAHMRWFLNVLFLFLFAAASLSSSEFVMPFPRPDLSKAHNPFSFIVYGDVQDVYENGHRKLVNQMEKESATFIVNTGDISPDDGRNYGQYFYPEIQKLASRIPLFPAPGNHDIEFLCETSRNPYRAFFKNAYSFLAEQPLNVHLSGSDNQRLWYSFRYATALFVALDSNLLIDSGRYRETNLLPIYRNYADEQFRWIKDVLEKSDSDPSIKSKFIFFHHSPFISTRNTAAFGLFGGHEDDSQLLINSQGSEPDGSQIHLLDLFRRHRVNAVLTGHQHYYERWRETIDEGNGSVHVLNWIVVGSGGVKPRRNRE
ncbi:MAG TPA: metallophosphoesterase, partial [Acidobacteriota bacterium]|nr:metallophosphoesterase [Acidobacteriota bacterium]